LWTHLVRADARAHAFANSPACVRAVPASCLSAARRAVACVAMPVGCVSACVSVGLGGGGGLRRCGVASFCSGSCACAGALPPSLVFCAGAFICPLGVCVCCAGCAACVPSPVCVPRLLPAQQLGRRARWACMRIGCGCARSQWMCTLLFDYSGLLALGRLHARLLALLGLRLLCCSLAGRAGPPGWRQRTSAACLAKCSAV
jgi:hypothetical protein